MASYGTFGYKKNKKLNLFEYGIFSLTASEINREMFLMYLYLKKFGADRFVKEVEKNAAGFQSVKYNMDSGDLHGALWQLRPGEQESAKLNSETSPYSNLYYNVDTKNIFGENKYKDYSAQFNIESELNSIEKEKIMSAIFEEKNTLMTLIGMAEKVGKNFVKEACIFYAKMFDKSN